jgi:type VI protein secretion system component Hcp
MSHAFRAALALAVLAASATPAAASVQIRMTVEGSRGPIGVGGDPGNAPSIKVTNVQLDLVPSVSGPLVGPKPVLVTRPVDGLSAPLIDAVASNDALQVVITTVRSAPVSGMPQRRVVRLVGARILFIHAALDATTNDRNELGLETIAFTYQRIEVEDDGVRVFTSGA